MSVLDYDNSVILVPFKVKDIEEEQDEILIYIK